MHFEYHESHRRRFGRSNGATARSRSTPAAHLISADTLTRDDVYNHRGQLIGAIEDIMLDMFSGRIGYAVLSFGGYLGLGDKLFAVPWDALTFDTERQCFLLSVEHKHLLNAPCFDKDDWPDMANPSWERLIHAYFGTRPFTREDGS
jgi:sporulation protein YlmC with PRC-barrel domain